MYLPLGPPSHSTSHPTHLGHHRTPSWAPCTDSWFPLAVHFTQDSVYRFQCYSPNLSHPPLSHPVSACPIFTSASLFLPPEVDSSVPFFRYRWEEEPGIKKVIIRGYSAWTKWRGRKRWMMCLRKIKWVAHPGWL